MDKDACRLVIALLCRRVVTAKELVQFGKQIGPSSATLESTRIQDLSAARTVSWR